MFITQNRRDILDKDGIIASETYEDLAYLAYKKMLALWNENPTWDTIHDIKREVSHDIVLLPGEVLGKLDFDDDDAKASVFLAWDMFFQLKVMPFAFTNKEKNGDIV